MLAIDPVECIDCGVCVDVCPVSAIYPEDAVPPGMETWIELNAELSESWPPIVESKDPLPAAEDWEGIEGKLQHLRT